MNLDLGEKLYALDLISKLFLVFLLDLHFTYYIYINTEVFATLVC